MNRTISEMKQIDVYFVGDSPTDALEGLPFDSFETAQDWVVSSDYPGMHIYAFSAFVNEDDWELIE